LLINPIVIIEILSKSPKKYDRTEKFTEYKTLPSFQEYVLIDSSKCHVETRFKEEPNLWRDTIVTDLSASIYLKSIDCSIALSDIYEDITLPLSIKLNSS
jgi:Uma2 family endonuclease